MDSLQCSGTIAAVAVWLAFLPLFLLMVPLLALLKLLSLLLLASVHLIHLLLLAALDLVLTLLVCILAAQSLLLLIIAPLHFLPFGVLLPLHFVELLFVLLLQSWIGGRIIGMPRGGRTIVSVVASATVVKSAIITAPTVIGSAMLNVATMEIAGTRSRRNFGAAVIDGSPETAVAASAIKMTVLL